MIQLTEKAIIKLRELSESEGIGHCNVRVRILGGGCAGFKHDMYYEDQITDMDEVTTFTDTIGEIKVIIDPLSYQYLDNTTIDWLDDVFSAGFKFINPNVTGSCGCGSSVEF